jgi:hypothetical protein
MTVYSDRGEHNVLCFAFVAIGGLIHEDRVRDAVADVVEKRGGVISGLFNEP